MSLDFSALGGKMIRPSPLPPLPAGYVRFTDSRGAVHDVPREHLAAARAIDPNLVTHDRRFPRRAMKKEQPN